MNRLNWFKNFSRGYGVKILALICGLVVGISGFNFPAGANSGFVGDLSRQSLTEVQVSLGNFANELKFFPNHLEFEAGKRYKLVLKNPSNQKHYFTAKDFADVSWTQKVEVGKAEIKGAIHEVELKPGGELEWVFVPIRPGNYQLYCSIPGHQEAGMTGEILIQTSAIDT
ncbi:MAG: hypothetical protein HC835_20065 [Oscillatoriales cyanobacterium RM2_1_1]|nr:hypothetical protein [Oscillatoriales cyanobacterium SM2_3_0]NJO47705.1 hypothetical protein [Oscillatoriales cyanobacterium RM2_1_1]